MSQLLISVKSVEEALIASYADVDLIDLKDPSVGALGALNVDVVQEVVGTLANDAVVSATVGEGHHNIQSLVTDIRRYAGLSVDVVKIAVDDLFDHDDFVAEMQTLTAEGIRLVAVFFADQAPSFACLATLEQCGFYGAMLDTKHKKSMLVDVLPDEQLQSFLQLCEQHHLISGLAGSVNVEHMDKLLALKPSFIGVRGGVCEAGDRVTDLSSNKLSAMKLMLLNYNK